MSDMEAEFIPEEESEGGTGAVKKLRERLATCVKEKQEYLEGWQRAKADFANYRKQESLLGAEKDARIKADILASLFPALDALELAVRHEEEGKTLSMLEKQFLSSLKEAGIERFGISGEAFDPRRHEALMQKETGEEEDGIVLSVERSGYRVGEEIIRPAQVSVGVYKQ